MQQHPVPQNVSSYQFRLVGDMTLKQFLELGGGLALAYLAFASNLLFFIKWPLVIIFGFLGVALAFFPIEERPLDQWIMNFIKAIYAPTRYVWKKSHATPSFFNFQAHRIQPEATVVVGKKPSTNTVLGDEFVPDADLDIDEKSRLSSLNHLFDSVSNSTPAPKIAPKPTMVSKPSVAVRKLGSAPSQSGNVVVFRSQPPPPPQPTISPTPTPQRQKSKDVVVPETQFIGIEKNLKPQNTEAATSAPTPQQVVFTAPTAAKHEVSGKVVQLNTSTSSQMPPMPKSPNIVVGTITNTTDRIVPAAIVQIIDTSGIPQRAVKSNELGQFFIATPLKAGDYVIETEKEGYKFSPQKLTINNQIIPPVKIQAVS